MSMQGYFLSGVLCSFGNGMKGHGFDYASTSDANARLCVCVTIVTMLAAAPFAGEAIRTALLRAAEGRCYVCHWGQ